MQHRFSQDVPQWAAGLRKQQQQSAVKSHRKKQQAVVALQPVLLSLSSLAFGWVLQDPTIFKAFQVFVFLLKTVQEDRGD